MRTRSRSRSKALSWLAALAVGGASLCGARATAQGGGFTDVMVQPPDLGAPQRGSVAGTLASLSFPGSALARGAHTLGLPIELPSERGAPMASIAPSYSPENGLSEWGMGWSAESAITRFRTVGDIDYGPNDELSSPWGRLVLGDDGAYYAAGMRSHVRITAEGGAFVATTSDGTRYSFTERVIAPSGTAACTASPCVYAWHLREVVSVLGATTSITYLPRAAHQRPLVSEVRWGASGQDGAHRVTLTYEPLSVPIDSYRPGYLLRTDRRVSTVRAYTRDAVTGSDAARWSYTLGYTAAASGPAFFLTSIERAFASGELEPATTYTYDDASQALATGAFEPVSELDAYIGTAGIGEIGVRADQVAFTDMGLDGVPEFEHRVGLALHRWDGSAWQTEPLVRAPGADSFCTPTTMTTPEPRHLAHVLPDDLDPQVVHTRFAGGLTTVTLCERDGTRIATATIGVRDYSLGARTRLVDVTRDHRPEIVRVEDGGYRVASLVVGAGAGGASTLSLVEGPFRTLRSPTGGTIAWATGAERAAWIDDVNGDGLVDLVGRTTSGLFLWHGLGAGRFETNARALVLRRATGATVSVSGRGVSFVDANADGLADVLLTGPSSSEAMLLTNRGGGTLREVAVPALASLVGDITSPVIVDLRRRGNTEVVYAHDGRVWALALDAPSTGQLVRADDGRGTEVRFALGRVDEFEGAGHRPSVLAGIEVDSVGVGTLAHAYTYEAPTLHTRARSLIGFDHVSRVGSPFVVPEGGGDPVPGSIEDTYFHHDDDVSVVVREESRDATAPDLYRYVQRTYEEASFRGLPFRRLVEEVSGVRGSGEELVNTLRVEAYDNELCPAVTVTSTAHGAMRRELTRAQVPVLDGAVHCVSESERIVGTHADSTTDFDMTQHVYRNDAGLSVYAEIRGGDETIPLFKAEYDEHHRIVLVSRPDQGITAVRYDDTGLPAELVSPTGVVTRAERDPRTSGVVALYEDRGGAGAFTHASYFRFDGMERLARSWTSVGGGSESDPLIALRYAFARRETETETARPAAIVTERLVDAATGSHETVAEWMAADGSAIARASLAASGWTVGSVARMDRGSARTLAYRRTSPLAASLDPAQVDLSTLLDGAVALSDGRTSPLAFEARSEATVQAGVAQSLLTRVTLEGGSLVRTRVMNGEVTASARLDLEGRVLESIDPTGAATRFRYDVMGRIVAVTLPGDTDGDTHRIRYDALGRPAYITRDDVGGVRYEYERDVSRLARVTYESAEGRIERTVDTSYDAAGRAVEQRHTLAATGEARVFSFRYDGAGSEDATAERGHLTAIVADHLVERMRHGADGAELEHTYEIPGWLSLAIESTHDASGALRTVTRTLRGADGSVIESSTTGYERDAHGRLAGVTIGGQPIADVVYDALGRIERVDLAGGQSISYAHDTVTGAVRGLSHDATDASTEVQWDRDARGQIAHEHHRFGDDVIDRDYAYDDRGFLVSAVSSGASDESASYAYDADGMPIQARDLLGDRALPPGPERTDVGGITYSYDASGRVIARGVLAVEYGPDGHLAHASRGESQLDYFYDVVGHRVLKVRDGVPEAAFLAGAFVDATGVIEPVHVGDRFVGVIDHGTFRLLATDARGTVIASEDGAPMLATPYGARAARPELSRAIDYVEQGYDADLGTVRMGVRDYDDRLGQFWTPDPLYLEQLGQCAESPVECNLYGYALGNPLSFVDPTGLGGETIRWVADSEDEDRVVALAPEDEVVDHTRPSNAALWNFTDALVRDINGWVGGTAWGRDASNAWTSVPGPYYSLDTAEVTGDLRGLLRQGFSPLADLSAQRNISLDCWSLFSFDASMGAELVLVNRVELTGPGTVGVSPRETRGMQTDSSQLSGSAKVDLERARVDGGTKLTASGSAGVTYGSSSQTQTQTTLGSTAPGVIWQGQLGVRISYTDSNGVSQSIVAVLPRTVQVRVREESRYAP